MTEPKYRLPDNLGLKILPNSEGIPQTFCHCYWAPEKMPVDSAPTAISSEAFKDGVMDTQELYTLVLRQPEWSSFFTMLPLQLIEINNRLAKSDLASLMEVHSLLTTMTNTIETNHLKVQEAYKASEEGPIVTQDGRLGAPTHRKDGWMYDRFVYRFTLQEIKKASHIIAILTRYRQDNPPASTWNPIPKIKSLLAAKEQSPYVV